MEWWLLVGGVGFLFGGWFGFFAAIVGTLVASLVLGLIAAIFLD